MSAIVTSSGWEVQESRSGSSDKSDSAALRAPRRQMRAGAIRSSLRSSGQAAAMRDIVAERRTQMMRRRPQPEGLTTVARKRGQRRGSDLFRASLVLLRDHQLAGDADHSARLRIGVFVGLAELIDLALIAGINDRESFARLFRLGGALDRPLPFFERAASEQRFRLFNFRARTSGSSRRPVWRCRRRSKALRLPARMTATPPRARCRIVMRRRRGGSEVELVIRAADLDDRLSIAHCQRDGGRRMGLRRWW